MALKKQTHNWPQRFIFLGIVACILISIFTRFVGLTKFPPSLYWEEAALGYDAYSILQTARDHHGHFLPLVAFESFGDYKPSFYFYSLVPSIAVFGLTDFAVRFPSAVSGVVIVVLLGLLAKEIGEATVKKKQGLPLFFPQLLQLFTMFIAAVNPWAIQFSRGGWEVNEATMLLTLGMYLTLLVRKKLLSEKMLTPQQILPVLMLSVVSTALSLYTYHATRVVAPVLLGFFWLDIVVELWNQGTNTINGVTTFIKKKLGIIILAGCIFTALISPVLISLKSSQTQQRFAETSLFADGRQVTLSNRLIELSNPKWLGKIVYHRYVISAQMITENYLKHFSLSFLFLTGDINPRHSTQFVGLFYTGEIVLLFAGIIFLIRYRNSVMYLVLAWLFVGILPAALTTATPHALRILPSMPAWLLLLGLGGFQVSFWAYGLLNSMLMRTTIPQKDTLLKILVLSAFMVFYGWQFVSYWRFYSLIYPRQYASEWQFGYKEMVTSLQNDRLQFPDLPVQITREYGRPAMYYWFYSKTNPKDVQAENAKAPKDQGEYLKFQNVSFVDQVQFSEKSLIASSKKAYTEVLQTHSNTKILNEISDPSGKIVWVLYVIE